MPYTKQLSVTSEQNRVTVHTSTSTKHIGWASKNAYLERNVSLETVLWLSLFHSIDKSESRRRVDAARSHFTRDMLKYSKAI